MNRFGSYNGEILPGRCHLCGSYSKGKIQTKEGGYIVFCNYCNISSKDYQTLEEANANFDDITFEKPIDMINAPPHYTVGNLYEPIAVIEDWKLDFLLGNVVKYISRHQKKGEPLLDLKKARWYLDRKIQNLEKEENKK